MLQRLSQGKANSNSKISKVKCQLPTLDFGRIEALLYSTGAYASIGRLIEFIFYIYIPTITLFRNVGCTQYFPIR